VSLGDVDVDTRSEDMSQVGRDGVLEQFDTKPVGDREVDLHLGPGRLENLSQDLQ
jgi:hypothetical protein